MAVICAHVKSAKDLLPGDVINIHGTGSIVEVVDIDNSDGIVYVDFNNGQDAFSTDHQVEYVTSEEWSRI